MSSAAERIRENALRVKGNNESRRAQPAQTQPESESQAPEVGRDTLPAEGSTDGKTTRSSASDTAPEAAPRPTPPVRTQRARKTESSSGTPLMFAPRQKPVRRTVDLTPAAHSKLDDWQRKTAREIGVARVSGQEVLAALVDEFLENPDLASVVRDSIWRKRQ